MTTNATWDRVLDLGQLTDLSGRTDEICIGL